MQSGIGRVQTRRCSLRSAQFESAPTSTTSHAAVAHIHWQKRPPQPCAHKPPPYLIRWRGACSPGCDNGAFAGQGSQHGDEREGEGRSRGDLAGRDTMSRPHVTHSYPGTAAKTRTRTSAPSAPRYPDARWSISVLLMDRHHTDPVILSPTEAQQGVVGII